MRAFFGEICNVVEADEYFGINEYTDLIGLTKPTVYMTIQEICDTHRVRAFSHIYLYRYFVSVFCFII